MSAVIQPTASAIAPAPSPGTITTPPTNFASQQEEQKHKDEYRKALVQDKYNFEKPTVVNNKLKALFNFCVKGTRLASVREFLHRYDPNGVYHLRLDVISGLLLSQYDERNCPTIQFKRQLAEVICRDSNNSQFGTPQLRSIIYKLFAVSQSSDDMGFCLEYQKFGGSFIDTFNDVTNHVKAQRAAGGVQTAQQQVCTLGYRAETMFQAVLYAKELGSEYIRLINMLVALKIQANAIEKAKNDFYQNLSAQNLSMNVDFVNVAKTMEGMLGLDQLQASLAGLLPANENALLADLSKFCQEFDSRLDFVLVGSKPQHLDQHVERVSGRITILRNHHLLSNPFNFPAILSSFGSLLPQRPQVHQPLSSGSQPLPSGSQVHQPLPSVSQVQQPLPSGSQVPQQIPYSPRSSNVPTLMPSVGYDVLQQRSLPTYQQQQQPLPSANKPMYDAYGNFVGQPTMPQQTGMIITEDLDDQFLASTAITPAFQNYTFGQQQATLPQTQAIMSTGGTVMQPPQSAMISHDQVKRQTQALAQQQSYANASTFGAQPASTQQMMPGSFSGNTSFN